MNASTRETYVTEQGETGEVARPRRRRGGWVTLLAILLVLVAIAVVGDRVAASFATRELRSRLVAEVNSHDIGYDSMDVAIGGFPFLTQVAKGHYDEITIDMTQVKLPAGNGRTATLPTLHVVADGVDANTADVVQGDAKVVADQVSGNALISFDTLRNGVDYSAYHLSNVTFAESGGGLKATATADVAGASIPLTAVADIAVVKGQLQLTLRDATAVGLEAPAPVRSYLSSLAARAVAARLPALPFGLALNKVSVQGDGLAVSVQGHNVSLAR
jgi:hypothetical protein